MSNDLATTKELNEIETDLKKRGFRFFDSWQKVPKTQQWIRYGETETENYLITVGGSTTELLVELLKAGEVLMYRRGSCTLLG